MNKAAIERFAIQARKDLIEQVSQRAYQYGITKDGYGEANAVTVGGRVLSSEEQKQRRELVDRIRRDGYEQVMEEVAYTWFNRFVALRFMEVNNYLPSHIRIFSDSTGAFKPEILNDVLHLDLPGLNTEKVAEYIEKNQTEDLYRYLLLTQCNALNESLPRMFERMGGYTELLLPNNILKQDSVIGHMVMDIEETDWTDQVQILGWAYQYYISEKHDQIININKGTVKKEDIPAATQLFTTDWVVRYMVDNSLGRYWIERHPESKLRDKLEFLVLPKSGEITYINEPVKPQDLTFFDPCMGSGHILVYAFDVLMEIYKECGYGERDAASEIIQNNLYGLDIDERCSQLAYFAVMMKARSFDRRFLTRGIKPHVLSIRESNGVSTFTRTKFMPDKEQNKIGEYLVELFLHAKEIGSLKTAKIVDYDAFQNYLEECAENAFLDIEFSLWNAEEKPLMEQLAEQAKILSRKYAVVCTNPPYMGKMEGHLKDYVITQYKDYSGDLFSAFIYHNFKFCYPNGYTAFMTPFLWMFIKTYEQLREYIVNQKNLVSLVQMEYSAFEEATVPICSFILRNTTGTTNSLCIKLSDFRGGMDVQKEKVLEALSAPECDYFYEVDPQRFGRIPGSPFAFWGTEKQVDAFEHSKALSVLSNPRQGLITGDVNRFVRKWYECSSANLNLSASPTDINRQGKWFPYCNGGGFRKWYGNNEDVVNWYLDGFEVKNFTDDKGKQRSRPQNQQYYYQEGGTWTAISSSSFSVRYFPEGFLFSNAGMAIYAETKKLKYIIGFLNSKLSQLYLGLFNEGLNYNQGDIAKLPILLGDVDLVSDRTTEIISISKDDWDSFETSWDFVRHPLVPSTRDKLEQQQSQFEKSRMEKFGRISWHFENWQHECDSRFMRLKSHEEELNSIFIDIYGLQDELTPEVEDKDVTVRKADLGRDVRALISYAVGCMFGRYSLDEPGLAYAGGEWDASKYSTIIPDKDNIIPICDDDYFDDDITGRFVKWVETVYGSETLEENLKFIADALGGKGTPREVIRSYFINDFYADHLKIYQKRPIYWLFDSGKKNGFKALIYMHRYQSDLLARMRTDYVHEQQERYRTQLMHLADAIDHASASERVKLTKQQKKIQEQALEIQKYEEKVHHLADQNIQIDLDDGIKHNYEMFADVLAKIK